MKHGIKSDLLVLRAKCGCIKKLFPAGEEAWSDEAARDAVMARGSLEVVSRDVAFAVVAESGRDCPHEMRWTAKCGLTNASIARFGHLDALAYIAPGPKDAATLHRLGIQGGRAFLPGILLTTLQDCIQLSFGLRLVVDGDLVGKVEARQTDAGELVIVSDGCILRGDGGLKAVSADASMMALGAAAMWRLGQAGRIDLLVPESIRQVVSQLRVLRKRPDVDGLVSMSDLVLTLFGSMAAHYLCLDLRIAAVALWVAERDAGTLLHGFCASLADVRGSAFASMSGMERMLSTATRRDRWLASETHGDRAAIVAAGADELIRGML